MSNDPARRKSISDGYAVDPLAALLRTAGKRPSPRKSTFLDNWLGTSSVPRAKNRSVSSKNRFPAKNASIRRSEGKPSGPPNVSLQSVDDESFTARIASHQCSETPTSVSTAKQCAKSNKVAPYNRTDVNPDANIFQPNNGSMTNHDSRILDTEAVVHENSPNLLGNTGTTMTIPNNPQDGSYFEIIDMTYLSSSASSEDELRHAESCRCNLCSGKKPIARKRKGTGNSPYGKDNSKRKLSPNFETAIDLTDDRNDGISNPGIKKHNRPNSFRKNRNVKRNNRLRKMNSRNTDTSSSDEELCSSGDESTVSTGSQSSNSDVNSSGSENDSHADSSIDEDNTASKNRDTKCVSGSKVSRISKKVTSKSSVPLQPYKNGQLKDNGSSIASSKGNHTTSKTAPNVDVDPTSARYAVSNPNSRKNNVGSLKPSPCTTVVAEDREKKEFKVPSTEPYDEGHIISDTRQESSETELQHDNNIDDHRIDSVYRLGAAAIGESTGYFSKQAFMSMWDSALDDMGMSLEEVESGNWVRSANNKLSVTESNFQSGAQYGRIYFEPTEYLFKHVFELTPNDVFVDIGHGVGNTVLQAAYTRGCEARGIELVPERNAIAAAILSSMENLRDVQRNMHSNCLSVGVIQFKEGNLEDPNNREHLTKPPASYYEETDDDKKGATKVLVNNFNGVFSFRSSKRVQEVGLDHFVAGLFAMMVPGSIMVTLYPLILPPDWKAVEETRGRHKEFSAHSGNLSFYTFNEITIGVAKDTVSWAGSSNMAPIKGYVYKRLKQDSDEAVFLCTNRECENAIKAKPIPAMIPYPGPNDEGRIINVCCDKCNRIAKNLRPKKAINYGDNSVNCIF